MGLEGVRSSTRLLDMGGGDIGSKAASDQRPGFQTSLHGLPAVQVGHDSLVSCVWRHHLVGEHKV